MGGQTGEDIQLSGCENRKLVSVGIVLVLRFVRFEFEVELGSRGQANRNLSIRNGVLLYKQLIRPMMDYACPIWRSAARSHVRKLQILQSHCDSRTLARS
jgi:hypothetical protein